MVIAYLIYNLAILAVSVFLTIHFNSGWWMLFTVVASVTLKINKGDQHDK